MKQFNAVCISLLLVLLSGLFQSTQSQPDTREVLRVGVVGDTGIGERAFHPGFLAVQEALVRQQPDLLLHLGDFVYYWNPIICQKEYLEEIKSRLVEPFKFQLFIAGDNDLNASRCWAKTEAMDTPFDLYPETQARPAKFEGSKVIGNTFFGMLNSHPWRDPSSWLAPRIAAAKAKGLWIVLLVHEPAITTAWFFDKRETMLKQLNALQPDLVFSANQHSYERFHPMTLPQPDGSLPVKTSTAPNYKRGDGTIHIVSGGGGATIKPFADLQGKKKRTAPKVVFNALAVRALMHHFVILEITTKVLHATIYRVCVNADGGADPRWKANSPMWENIALECEGKKEGVSEFDRFEIKR